MPRIGSAKSILYALFRLRYVAADATLAVGKFLQTRHLVSEECVDGPVVCPGLMVIATVAL